MKILVGNNKLRNPGGSETFTYALVHELVRRGHDVSCVTSGEPGIVSEQIMKLGVPVFRDRLPSLTFDVALLSHSTSIVRAKRIKAFRIQTCHGIFHPLEKPVSNMDAYVAISEEVAMNMMEYSPKIIYNGVDCNRFRPVTELNHTLNCVLSLVHSDKANDVVKKACSNIGCEVIVQNKYITPIWEMETLINQADLIIGLGRSAYESASCGKNVVIFDYRPYMGRNPIGDGFLTTENFPLFLKNNCSGRYSNKEFSVDLLQEELEKYDLSEGVRLRNFVFKNLNIANQVDKYLSLIR